MQGSLLRKFGLLVFILFSPVTFAEEDCEGPDTSSLYEGCMIMKDLKSVDAELNTLYKQHLGNYQKSGLDQTRQGLIEAERAWLKFKDKTCDFENDAFGGINSIGWARCQHRMTQERVEYLKGFDS